MKMTNILAGTGFILILLLANSNKSEPSPTEKEVTPTGIISKTKCVNNVNKITMYNKSRLNSSLQSNNSILVTYLSDTGNLHKFRCIGSQGKVQLFADGTGMWLNM